MSVDHCQAKAIKFTITYRHGRTLSQKRAKSAIVPPSVFFAKTIGPKMHSTTHTMEPFLGEHTDYMSSFHN